MNNLQTVIKQLKSEKIRDRQEGLSSLRTVFGRDSAVASLDAEANGKTNGKAWLMVFQALFNCVLLEKMSLTKTTKSGASTKVTSSAAATRRLSDAAAAVRWLTERSVHRLNKKVTNALLTHLLQAMVHHGELLTPVALDYIKALRCVVGWTPHLEHMSEDHWVDIVQLGWNIVLGDPIRQSLDDGDEAERAESLGVDDEEGDDMYLDDESDEGDDTSNQSLKRRRAPSATPRASSSKTPLDVRSQPPQKHSIRGPSLEQIEYTALLAIMLRFPSAPWLSQTSPYLASSLLRRFQRFIEIYPTDTSMHHDYILSLSAALSHLSLNKKQDVTAFSRSAWDGLVGLWGTKNKRMKEGLVGVLRVLLPFYTATGGDYSSSSSNSKFDCSGGIGQLFHLLNGEAESRWGVDGLSIDSLRLEIMSSQDYDEGEKAAFQKGTFRSGWHFDAGQALAWATIELQADCAHTLFQISESVHSSSQSTTIKLDGKRVRLENSIASLLSSIRLQTTSNIRAFHIQTLLFFIDLHWATLHDSLQDDVISTLLQFVSLDDGIIQSWTFLCFAAIVHADSFTSRPRDASVWDPIWTHAMRRANVPGVCRAACHTAHALLSHWRSFSTSQTTNKRLLTSHRVLLEIETLSKDLDVQGPSFPYDSVCAFLAECLRVASQDVRLHRMQLEEKAIGWLIDCWTVREAGSAGAADRSRMPLHTVKDMMVLLESACGFSKRSDLVSRFVLPGCLIVETVVDEQRTQIIRNFLLHATLPRFRGSTHKREELGRVAGAPVQPSVDESDLVPARSRERRVSAFLLKSLEAVLVDWETIGQSNTQPSAERGRRSLDLAILAISFESLLVLNGVKATRRVIQVSCKLVGLIIPLLTDTRWTADERSLVIHGLEPLIYNGEIDDDEGEWVALVPPDKGTGIEARRLKELRSNSETRTITAQLSRRNFQRIIWKNTDVQEVFGAITGQLKDILGMIVGDKPGPHQTLDTDDRDGFAPIRTNHAIAQSAETGQQIDDTHSNRCIANICMAFLTVVPVLQSLSGEPTRDKGLTELTLNCSADNFLLLGPIYFSKVRQRVLYISVNVLGKFLEKFEVILRQYEYSRSERLQLLVTQFLESTLHLWKQDVVVSSDVGGSVCDLCQWLSDILRAEKIRSWRTRDRVARFMQQYILEDPTQVAWTTPDSDEEPPSLPIDLLPMLGADRDVRIRFRVASSTARLFAVAHEDPSELYMKIKGWLTNDIDDYERMMTRMLSLGNVMVVSSAVRRAPYFHLLEGVFYSPQLVPHVEAILKGVSERLGLMSFSQLFEAYASQIAFSIRQADKDILAMPPHLLGYRGRRECAEATFRAFTPSNIMAGGSSPEAIAHGQRLFNAHCKTIQKSPAEGIRDCFGDIVGYQIVIWSDAELNSNKPQGSLADLQEQIRVRTAAMRDQHSLEDHLQDNVDGIVVAILRTLADQNFMPDGAIVQALQSAGESNATIQAFNDLARFRNLIDVELHKPNLPNYSTLTILRAFRWLHQLVPEIDTRATTYHVLHQLFADVQHTPLVNEQIRVVNGISLWTAIHYAEFKDLTLLHTLIHGSTSLLGQSDLARAAQSILNWAFSYYREVGQKSTRLPDVLVRVCCFGHEYANAQDEGTKSMGRDILHWIDDQALQMCKSAGLRNQVARALPAWPHQPSPELCQISSDISSGSLSAVLNESRISSNKFRLVRRFRDLAIAGSYDAHQFAKTDFWRLKECIPSMEQLQKEDVDAFAALLVSHQGRIHSFSPEQSASQSLRARHRRGNRKRDSYGNGDDASPQRVIVHSMLNMLDANISPLVHVAYNTMRLSMSLSTSDAFHLQSWPSEYRTELEYLQRYPRTPVSRPARDLSELASSKFSLEHTSQFPIWIAEFTVILSDMLVHTDPFYAQITSILQCDVEFAEQVLPILVHTVLQQELLSTSPPEVSSRTRLSAYFTSILASGCENVSCLRCIVDVILHLRNFRPSDTKDPLGHEKWLDVDFTLLSRNAVTCGAYTTALLFLELAAEYQTAEREDSAAEQILFDIYSHIDEPDGFYGIKTTDLRQFLIKRFHHENQWEKAFRFHGAAIEASRTNTNDANGLLDSFHAFGFNHLAIETLQGSRMGVQTGNASTMSYRLGWRTETWDLPDQREGETTGASLYLALRAVHRERDTRALDSIIWNALSEEMMRLRTLGPENLIEIRDVAQNLMCLNQVTQWRGSTTQKSLGTRRIDSSEWADFVHVDSDFEFSDLEHIMATRISLIRSIRQREQREQIGTLIAPFARSLIEIEKQCLVRLSMAARDSNQIQIALNSIIRAQGLEDSPSFEVSQEFASVLWLQREQKLAVQFLKELVERDNGSSPDLISLTKKASLLARLGAWTSEACLEKPTDILTRFFEPATSIVDDVVSNPDNAAGADYATVYHQCAMFAEHQYLTIVRSPDTIRWKIYIDRKTQEIQQRQDQLQKTHQGSKDFLHLSQVQKKAQALLVQDQTYFQQESGARNTFLEQAIDMYSRCLATSDAFDDDGSIRLCSLWFANFHDLPLQAKVRIALERVPSRKFVFLAHQLSARLSATSSGKVPQNQANLQTLVSRMCQEHPFHSLYQVYALKPDRSHEISTSNRRQSSRHDVSLSQADRGSAAGEIFDRLRGDTSMGQRVRQVEIICEASLEWAKFPIKKDSRFNAKGLKGPFKVPGDLSILKIENLQVPVVTAHTPLDPTLRYDNCVWITSFEKTFDTAGGVNLPKISICNGSDGRRFKQLYKGEGGDDLRQDAVMEQVFELVNTVLLRDRETRKRALSVRDYRVIPLAAQAGVLEFVGNTIPLQAWLSQAHVKYRPTDKKHAEIIKLLTQTRQDHGGATEPLVKLFKEIMPKFQPVMRHYFTEKHKTPISWYAMRLNYTRSVATTSIVGHILGLGDRHNSNILIDNVTGEVVHIDLGIAFDQGKILPVPERVPFRMTRDIVDGMGTSGTQGVFQRCAEETLRVLRDRSDVIMTVLEVFKYDPLHSWTASELKIKRAQAHVGSATNTHAGFGGIGIDMSSGTVDEAADRALSSVSRKLDKVLSVEYTVNELIAEATDIANIATIYFGWGPQY